MTLSVIVVAIVVLDIASASAQDCDRGFLAIEVHDGRYAFSPNGEADVLSMSGTTDCEVVATFPACIGVGYSEPDANAQGTQGVWTWVEAATQRDARAAALEECERRAGTACGTEGAICIDAPPVEAGLGLDRAARRRSQERLQAVGFDPGGADGLFDPRTLVAIPRWQGAGCACDGLPEPAGGQGGGGHGGGSRDAAAPTRHRGVRDREEVTNSELPSTVRCCGRRRASSDPQRARVLAGVQARRSAPRPFRGAHRLDAGSAHARPDGLLPTMPNPDPLHVVVDERSRMTPFPVTVDTAASSQSPASKSSAAAAQETVVWQPVVNSTDPCGFRVISAPIPRRVFSDLARNRLPGPARTARAAATAPVDRPAGAAADSFSPARPDEQTLASSDAKASSVHVGSGAGGPKQWRSVPITCPEQPADAVRWRDIADSSTGY